MGRTLDFGLAANAHRRNVFRPQAVMRRTPGFGLAALCFLGLVGCADLDLDGVQNDLDNCPYVFNPEQLDADGNGIGDTCQFVPKDTDADGVDDSADNCRYVANSGQADGDGDGAGDACDDSLRRTIREVLEEIAGDDTQGRLCLSEGNALARSRLAARMESLGLAPAGSLAGSYDQPFFSGVNLVGVFEPAGTAGLPPQVLLGAHHDHLGATAEYGCRPHPEALSQVCNGATDNAAAVGAVLAALETVMPEAGAPVAVAFWDAEEFGKLGSRHWVENPTFDTRALRLYINLDVIGANLFIGLEDETFAIGAESGGSELLKDLHAARGVSALATRVLSTALGQGRSDHEILRRIVPFVFFSDGTGPSYHTAADEIHRVNLDKAVEVARVVAALSLRAVERTAGYPQTPVDPELPLFSDAQPLRDGLARGRSLADANGIEPQIRLSMEGCLSVLEGILARGPEACTLADRQWIGLVGLRMIDISTNLPFLPPP